MFCVNSKHFSKIWQICLIWQIHFGKTSVQCLVTGSYLVQVNCGGVSLIYNE